MANTKSAKKAIRSSERKRSHNAMWEKRIKETVKVLKTELDNKNAKPEILNSQLTAVQKVLDKAAKEKVIHKNKSNRLKSRYAKSIAALLSKKGTRGSAKSSE
ncbi:30S ribosomal protein S20 [candidate division WWE3 bacterium]|jgi:small subunit ribosomal protein S20|uniref:Small ribosomal subunit protein bS20 n=1 Tax=candidate division WWE3 bacterium TaxID=2053526 RepID=A0A3A4ZCB1_UNCKA|nr:MAG: 30S ribosomal protein S20 [candidate division WWE3 bacterium]